MRECILLPGNTNVGKTLTLIHLAVLYPESQVVIFDPENKARARVEDMGLDLPNLTIVPVTPRWDEFAATYHSWREVLTENDWCCFDMMSRFWDLAQNYFSRSVFGVSPAEHIIALRKASKRADFEGFDGLTDWTVIKRLHNEDIMDDAVLWSPCNVAATTSLTDYSAREKIPKTGVEGLMVREFPSSPKIEGEKHNRFRFDHIAVLYQNISDGHYYFKTVKYKARPVVSPIKEYDITGCLFWEGWEKYKKDMG